jgi:hypothetical protein
MFDEMGDLGKQASCVLNPLSNLKLHNKLHNSTPGSTVNSARHRCWWAYSALRVVPQGPSQIPQHSLVRECKHNQAVLKVTGLWQ